MDKALQDIRDGLVTGKVYQHSDGAATYKVFHREGVLDAGADIQVWPFIGNGKWGFTVYSQVAGDETGTYHQAAEVDEQGYDSPDAALSAGLDALVVWWSQD